MVEQVKNSQTETAEQTAMHKSFLKRTTGLFADAIYSIRHSCSMDLGVDLGTCSTVISLKGHGIVLNEPTVIAVDKARQRVLHQGEAVGSVACAMLGKTPRSIATVRPMRDGVISDFEATEAMLASFIRRIRRASRRRFVKPTVTIAVPCRITEVQRRAVVESAERIGASRVFLVDEPMAAGIGAGLPIANPTASMIVDIGGGTCEVAIISLGDIAESTSIPVAGNAMDDAIIDFVRKEYNLEIGPQRAEKLKIEIGSAAPLDTELKTRLLGRDSSTSLPRQITVTSDQIREALKPAVAEIIEAVAATMQNVAPELAADLIDNGIHICGGGSLLRNIDKVLQTATGLRVTRVEDPLLAVAKGTQTYIENIDMLIEAANRMN